MGNLLFWLGIGAAQRSKPIKRRHWVASLVVGSLIALLIAVGMFVLLVSQHALAGLKTKVFVSRLNTEALRDKRNPIRHYKGRDGFQVGRAIEVDPRR